MPEVHKYHFYFRIESKAEMAVDEDGSPIECYARVGLDRDEPFSDGEYEETAGKLAEVLAELLEIERRYVVPVTKEDYLANAADDDNDFVRKALD
ncbi:hypothetical protein G7K71_13570 [Desulfofundulus sp. TPOSR]|uniref:hypothetical protein n=1 Tax=Desulfofundulus sp. TPOSR TaxID=2714340 RepID=UPI00140C373D|nr:hypothetical protein [Desulfofundulus sp. TPOSR]NHM27987.1 hypothetical protein [Desulfofundulus sp. TPOSR]